jgi:hypothetical protein
MHAVYTKQSIEDSGFAGLQSSRITEIFYGYPYNQSTSRRITSSSNVTNDGKLMDIDMGIYPHNYHNFNATINEGEKQKGTLGNHSNRPIHSIKKKVIRGITNSVETCLNDIENAYCRENVPSGRRSKTYRRRLATPEEHKTSFNRSYICTDKKSGRTEMLTTRRVGSATLDIDITDFDAYASHLGRRLVAACEKKKNEQHIDFVCYYYICKNIHYLFLRLMSM